MEGVGADKFVLEEGSSVCGAAGWSEAYGFMGWSGRGFRSATSTSCVRGRGARRGSRVMRWLEGQAGGAVVAATGAGSDRGDRAGTAGREVGLVSQHGSGPDGQEQSVQLQTPVETD